MKSSSQRPEKYQYTIVFEFATDQDFNEDTLKEFGNEVHENVCAFFRAKRVVEPTVIGSISIRKKIRQPRNY